MAYNETSLVAQFNGAFRCATTVVVRTPAAETTHQAATTGADVSLRQRRESLCKTDMGVELGSSSNANRRTSTNGNSSSHALPPEGAQSTLWLARSDGSIEIRPAMSPDRAFDRISRKSHTLVTSLLQIGHNRVVAGHSDGFLRIFDAVTFQECQSARAHTSAITCMVSVTMTTVRGPEEVIGFPRASVFITASSDSTIAKWDGVTLECLGRLKGHRCGVTALAATIGGAFIFSGGEDGSLRMWSLIENIQVIGRSTAKKKTGKKGIKQKDPLLLSINGQEQLQRNQKQQEQQQQHQQQSEVNLVKLKHIPQDRRASHALVRTTAVSPAMTPRAGRSSPAASLKTPRTTRAISSNPSSQGAGRRRIGTRARSESPTGRLIIPPAKSNNTGISGRTPRRTLLRCTDTLEIESSVNDDEDDDDEDDDGDDQDSSDREHLPNTRVPRQMSPVYGNIRPNASLTNASVVPTVVSEESKKGKKSVKVKKSKKCPVSQFSDIFQQLMKALGDAPISQRLAVTHGFENEEGDEATLLWPLKREHQQTITCLALAWDRLLVSASRDGTIRLFALPSGRMLRSIHRCHVPVTGLTIHESRCLLWVGSADGCFYVYDLLHPSVVQVHAWRDLSIPHPILVPLVKNEALNQLCVFATSGVVYGMGNSTLKRKSIRRASPSVERVLSLSMDSSPGSQRRRSTSPTPVTSTVTSIMVEDVEGETITDMRKLRTLDKQLVALQNLVAGSGLRDAIFRKILHRPVSQNGEELPEYLRNEKLRLSIAMSLSFMKLLLQRSFKRWETWSVRRVARYRRIRKVCFLASLQQERLLGIYFRRWRRRNANSVGLLEHVDISTLERRANNLFLDWGEKNELNNFSNEIGNVLNRSNHYCLMQRYYYSWYRYATETRRYVLQSAAFNRLYLSFCDVKFDDARFIWNRLKSTVSTIQWRRRAIWLLEQRMETHNRQRCRDYMKKWQLFIKHQREARQALILVEPLSSMLVDENKLRLRVYFKWYRFAIFEAKLRRLEDEKTTMHREWIAVQNAVDSTTTVSELRNEKEQLEVGIAQLAFELDEVDSQNANLLADIQNLHVQKSLECLLAGYRDPTDVVVTHRSSSSGSSIQRNRGGNNSNRDRIMLFFDDETNNSEVAMLRQVGSVLRALKATAIRCGKHRNLIMAANERTLQLPITESTIEGSERSASISFCSTGGDSSILRGAPVSSLTEGKVPTERRKSMTSLSSVTVCLADEFDRVAQRLQTMLVAAARQTGVELDEPLTNVIPSSSSMEYSITSITSNSGIGIGKTDRTSLRWLNFVPPTTRAEVLPLILDLVAMFDSVKAHSDMELEGSGRKISTRGAPIVVPLPLRSLCKPQTAMWLVQHAAVLLELMSPGIWQRHLKLRVLADAVADSNMTMVSSVVAETSPARSTVTTERTLETPNRQRSRSDLIPSLAVTPQRTQRQTCPKLSMEEVVNTQQKRSRPLSWCAPVSRSQSCSKPLTSPSSSSSTRRSAGLELRKGVSSGVNSTPPLIHSHDIFREDENGGPCPLPPILSPAPRSGASTPTKVLHSSTTTKPYLGFRVAVGRDDSGRTTLTVHEVTESYINSSTDVKQEGPAFAAGLRAGDQLVRFAGYAVTELAAFNAVVARHVRPSASIPVVFSRDGELLSATIIVGEKDRSVESFR